MPLATQKSKVHVLSLGHIEKAISWALEGDLAGSGGRPDVLYHYTDIQAAHKMVESGTVWTTSPWFANDWEELRYLKTLVLDEAERYRLQHGHLPDAVRELAVEACDDLYRDGANYRVASFCAEGDLLSQWRAYGRFPNIAYSLGVKASELAESVAWRDEGAIGRYAFELRKVVYDKRRQRELVGLTWDAFMTVAPSLLDGSLDVNTQPVDRQYVKELLIEMLEPLLVILKSPDFSEEREWRLVGSHQPEAGPSPLRVTPYGIAPYECAGVRSTRTGNKAELPLTRIVQGPTPYCDSALYGMRALLTSKGYKPDEVELAQSSASLR